MRFSSQRELVKEIVQNTFTHPTAEEIYVMAKKVKPNISLGTVYRGLKILSLNGEISTIETVDKKIRYDGNMVSHVHTICLGCGKITDVCASAIPKEIEETGFSVTGEKCVYYGLCPDCKNKK